MQTDEIDLRIGDIVLLNSGSPDLTVTNIDGANVTVTWNDGSCIQSSTFPRACIRVKPKTEHITKSCQ
jgi:uncharacterized protein YodC (DUF2158 family)